MRFKTVPPLARRAQTQSRNGCDTAIGSPSRLTSSRDNVDKTNFCPMKVYGDGGESESGVHGRNDDQKV
jgi:hypothetical protein